MASPSNLTVDAAVLAAQRSPVGLKSMHLSRSRDRFIVIGVALLFAIVMGDWLIVSNEREAALASRARTNTLLDLSMIGQASWKLGAVDKVLTDIPAALGVADISNADLMKATLRSPAASDLLADHQKQLEGIEALTLVDVNGQIANNRGNAPLATTDVSRSEFFLRLRLPADAEPFVSAPEQDTVSGAWSSFIARRMTDAHGDFAGVILAKLSLSELEDFYRIVMPLHRALTVMRNDGTVLFQYPHAMDRTGQRVAGFASRGPRASGCSTYQGPDLVDGAPVVAAVCGMRNMPLTFQASATQDEALEGWKQGRPWLVLGGVVASVVVIGLLRLFASQVRRLELSELSLAAEKNEAQTAHRQLESTLSNIPQGVCFFDADQRLILSNRRYLEIYGLSPESVRPGVTLAKIVGLCYADVRVSNYESADYLRSLETIARAGEPHHSVLELEDGRTISVQSQPMPDGGWVATHEDITERRKAEEKIAFLAKHDSLTGLANRSLLMERIALSLNGASRGNPFAVLFLDLDRFKAVNDTLGHDVGDELLRTVATRLTGTVSRGSTVARLGGDEFVVLQTGVKVPEDAARLARRIIDLLAAPYMIGEHEVIIGVSVGVAISSQEASAADTLLKNADLALYRSKAQGRGTFRFFEPEIDSDVRNRRVFERAIFEQQLEIH